jgi:hypothetical protein
MNIACCKAILHSYEICLLLFRKVFAISKNVSVKAVNLDGKLMGLCSSVVVKALCYKPEGRGFDIR